MSENKSEYLYSIEFQRTILKLLCNNLKFATEYGSLIKAEYLETKSLKILYEIIYKYILTYEAEVDRDQLFVKIEEYITSHGYGSEIAQLLFEEVKEIYKLHIKSEQSIIDSFVKFARRQEFKNAILECVNILEKDPDGSYEKGLKLIDEAVSVGCGVDEGLNFDSIINLKEVSDKVYSEDKLIKTGMHKFDRAFGGGLAPGELHIIQAPPKCGKSTMGCNIGTYNIATGKNVFHISLEISEIAVATKYACRLTGLTYSEFNNIHTPEYKSKIERFLKYKPNLFIKYWPEGTANTLHIRSWISRVKSKMGVKPDLIIVDYDDCLCPIRGNTDDMYNDAGEIYKDLIQLADYFKVPIISFAQPNREGWAIPNKGELIRKEHLAHSARKAHRAWSLSSINFADDKPDGILYISDNRRGDSHVKIPITRDLAKAMFKEKSE
jgi:archaellum biogenesis ATPase FlaH